MINLSLRLGTIQAHKINVEFSLDVFRFLFNGKGRRPDKGRGMLYGRKTLINSTLGKTGGHHMTSLVTDAVLTFHCG